MIRTLGLALALSLASSAYAHPPMPDIVSLIPPRGPEPASKQDQIERGRRLFNEETFNGNGRTCATCHAAAENFSLSPADVKRRSPDDPLFVFKRIPGLAPLENEEALRSRALICENTDSFANPCTLRGSMGVAGLALTTKPPGSVPDGQVATLGWGGDGAPGDDSVRNFAVGAIVQHLTRSLDRKLGRDFRMPTADELDAMEAFQLSLGRRKTPITDPAKPGHLVFRDANVSQGQVLFHGMPSRLGTRACSECHVGGGALNEQGVNDLVATGTEFTSAAPACFFTVAPGDAGNGGTPLFIRNRHTFCVLEEDADNDTDIPFAVGPLQRGPVRFHGSQKFNVQSLIEAAGTAPFFHDNSAPDLETAISFYSSDTFSSSPKGAGNGFLMQPVDRNDIAAFLRSLNVLDAIGNARRVLLGPADTKVSDARLIIRSAVRVLGEGSLRVYPDARRELIEALNDADDVRKILLELRSARHLILDVGP